VEFADQRGWRELTTGDLRVVAERDGFDVVLTADTNLRYQQNLPPADSPPPGSAAVARSPGSKDVKNIHDL
jgi:hypothetical protein